MQKQIFGKSFEKIEREIAQLELALEDLLIAADEQRGELAGDEDIAHPPADAGTAKVRPLRGPRVSDGARGNTANSTLAPAALIATVTSVSLAST